MQRLGAGAEDTDLGRADDPDTRGHSAQTVAGGAAIILAVAIGDCSFRIAP